MVVDSMEYVPGKRSSRESPHDRQTLYTTSFWSRLQPTTQVTFLKRISIKSREHQMDTWQPRWHMIRPQCNWSSVQISLYDYSRINQIPAIDISKDVTKCFKRMIKACMNMSCCQQGGADLSYLKLHVAMQLHMCYYVKHAIGILTQYNQHSDSDPWYGASQGAGDTCHHWVVQANSMILAYKSMATLWVVSSPNYSKQFTQFIDAFIDDTSLISAQKCHQNFCKLLMTLQQNLDLWHGLLQASGSVLNLSSCVWLSSLGNLLLMAQCRLYHHLKSHHCTQQLTMHYLFPSSNFSHRRCTDIWAST